MHWLVLQSIKTDYNTNQMIFPTQHFIYEASPESHCLSQQKCQPGTHHFIRSYILEGQSIH